MTLKALLERGYFPKELPAPFTTVPFSALMSGTTPVAGDFAKSIGSKFPKVPSSKATRYSLARSGLFRRSLSICNPLPFYHLCHEIIQNQAAIMGAAAGTPLSATTPEFKATGRAIDGKWGQSDRSSVAQSVRLGRKHVLHSDISRFYPSIYTHAIPWALHTKPIAKADRGPSLLGNRLDFWVRMGQDQQTVGLPIGPDTSLLISELIMQRCDNQILTRMPQTRGSRFVDDYELAFATRTEAEDAFHIVERALGEFELALNPKKTRVFDLPQPLEAPWATKLKQFSLRSTERGQARDLENYFSVAYQLHTEFPDEAVLQFSVARLRYMDIHPANWSLLQRLLLLCVIPEPSSLPYVLEQIIRRMNAGIGPLISEVKEVLHSLIGTHASQRHSSEVANSIWACLALQLQISGDACDAISACDDTVVALLALDAEAKGLTAKVLDKTVWSQHMTPDGLYEEHWLLSYEANLKGWLPTLGGGDHVMADPTFAHLKTNGVFFYDQTKTVVQPNQQAPLPTLPTFHVSSGGY